MDDGRWRTAAQDDEDARPHEIVPREVDEVKDKSTKRDIPWRYGGARFILVMVAWYGICTVRTTDGFL